MHNYTGIQIIQNQIISKKFDNDINYQRPIALCQKLIS